VEWLCGKVGCNMQAVCPAAPPAPITKNKGEVMTAWYNSDIINPQLNLICKPETSNSHPYRIRCDVFEQWPLTPTSRDDSAGLAASVAAVHKVMHTSLNVSPCVPCLISSMS
jgi:hypothetical protein